MRNRTKKCIVLLLAILLLCLCVWRLTPRTFGQMTGADPQTISSLYGTAVLGGNRDGTPYMESYTLPISGYPFASLPERLQGGSPQSFALGCGLSRQRQRL